MVLRRLAVCLLMLVASPAVADRIYADDSVSLANFFLNEGLDVEPDIDAYGDPMLFIEGRGYKVFTVYFFDCDNGTDCRSVQFYKAYVHQTPPDSSKLWDMNLSHRYIRAFLDRDGDPALEMDLYLGVNGMDADEFWAVYNEWLDAADAFHDLFSRD